MKKLDVFRIPVYEFKFEDHNRYASEWKNYIDGYPHYSIASGKTVKISLPNLHKSGVWAPLTLFARRCIDELRNDLSFHFEMDITSMWSTVQEEGGFHHMHTHKNSAFVGIYYLYSDVEDANGTFFHNSMSDFSPFKSEIDAYKVKDESSWYEPMHHVSFEAGKLVLFPAWLRHSGMPHKGKNRQIIAFNVMPIGQIDRDPYQRYRYADFRDQKMFYDDML